MINLGIYKHYKGDEYEVVGLAHHTETKTPLVLYKPLYSIPDLEEQYNGDIVFARPIEMFTETVEINGKDIPRFEFKTDQP